MHTDTYITASCVISSSVAYRNGHVYFENKGVETAAFFTSLYQYLGGDYPKFYKMDSLSKLGWLAAEILINKRLLLKDYLPEETGVILSNSSSSLDVDLKYYESAREIASPSLFVYTLPNIMIGEICIRHRIKGENAFFISPRFDAPFMEQYVTNLINNNILQACICGWVELIGNEYKGALFLVEKSWREESGDTAGHVFNVENINKIYQTENG